MPKNISRIPWLWRLVGEFLLGLIMVGACPQAVWALGQGTLTEGNAQANPWSFTLGVANPVTIPTLSQWGLIIFALLIAVLAFKHLRWHRGPAGVALVLILLLWTRMVSGSGVGWPLATASHEPSASIIGNTGTVTMRSPLNPAAGQVPVLIVAQLAPVSGDSVTGMVLHYQKMGDGSTWRTTTGAVWGAPACSNCWAASLPLNGYVASDQIRYYLSVATGTGGTAHSTCVDGNCPCNSNWAGGSCNVCASGYYGASCTLCPNCGAHGTCLDGLAGNGICSCAVHYSGADCSTLSPCSGVTCGAHSSCVGGSCVCNSNWAGGSCNVCASGYYGAACDPCSCGPHGICSDGLSGDGSCSCDESYTGTDCTSCLYMHLPNGDCVDNCTVNPSYPYVFQTECVDACPDGYVLSIANFCVEASDIDGPGPWIPANQ
jgi:hypothetical protein